MAKVLEKMTNYSNKFTDYEITCPRYIHDVYSIGTNLQYYIGDIYLQLAEVSQEDLKNQFTKMAFEEFEIKNKIQKIDNAHLNELIGHFYNSGGSIIEPALSYQRFKARYPFFNRILNIFTKQVESSMMLAANGSISAGDLKSMVNYGIIQMYTNLSKLLQVSEIAKAFEEMIAIREGIK